MADRIAAPPGRVKRGGFGSLPRLERLQDLLEAVLHGIVDRRAARLVPDLEDRIALLVLPDELDDGAGVRHPAAPESRAAIRLPGVADVALDRQVAAAGHD